MPQGKPTISGDAWDALPDAPKTTTTAAPTSEGGSIIEQLASMLGNTAIGAGKSLAETGVQGGKLLRMIPGMNTVSNALPSVDVNLEREGAAQHVGAAAERLAELMGGGSVLSGALKPGVVNAGLRMSAGNPLLMHAGTAAEVLGNVGAAGASGVAHGDKSVGTNMALGAAGPLAGEGVAAMLRTPTGAGQILPYLVAILTGKLAGGIGNEGLGAALGGFGLTRLLARQALKNPNAIPVARRALTTGGQVFNAAQAAEQDKYK